MEWYYAEGDEQRGPLSENELIALVEQGVIRSDTLVWNNGMADWLPYGEVHAQSDSMRSQDTVVTGTPNVPNSEEATEPLAIASLVLAIVSCGCGLFTAIPAIICGHMALDRINKAEGRIGGRPLALGGLVIGYIRILLSILSLVMWLISIILSTATP